jgi:hypothetical protein
LGDDPGALEYSTMAIHVWTRVDAGIFHDFHLEWISALKRVLNQGVLPPEYYGLAEQFCGGLEPDVLTLNRTAAAESDVYAQKHRRIAIRHVSGDQIAAIIEILSPGYKQHALRSFVEKALEFLDAGIHLLIVDLFPPGPRDPQGIHAAIWSNIKDEDFILPDDKPLTLAAYAAGPTIRAFIEPAAVGDALADMPLFLEPEFYVRVPLETAYRAAFDAVPRRWREVLEGPTA